MKWRHAKEGDSSSSTTSSRPDSTQKDTPRRLTCPEDHVKCLNDTQRSDESDDDDDDDDDTEIEVEI